MGINEFAPFQPNHGTFTVRNIAPDKKTIKIFQYPIPYGQSRDLLKIPGVGESDLRTSLLKGELLRKIKANEIYVEDSDIDLLQFNDNQKQFLKNAGIIKGLEVSGGSGTGGFDMQDIELIGIKDNVNTVFATPTKFKHTSQYKEVLYVNGLRQHIPEDYQVSESMFGTGYDLITFVIPPYPDDLLIVDYFEV